nr:VrrA/YqfQ family protein [Bacillus subtilis]
MFSPQQPMRNYPQPGPPRPMPNQRMMGRRPPNMRGPSFGAQQQGFQQAGQFLPQANAGARNGAGAGGGLKGMLSRFLPGGGGAGSAGVPGIPGAGAAASGGAGTARHSKHCQSCIIIQYAWKCAKSTRHGAASHPYDPAVLPLVRNLPAMMKLYSQLSKSDDTETEYQ